jgi:hypothetical protein
VNLAIFYDQRRTGSYVALRSAEAIDLDALG